MNTSDEKLLHALRTSLKETERLREQNKKLVGTRLEVLCAPVRASDLERRVLQITTTLGVRAVSVVRRALAREMRQVEVLGQTIRVKIATLPDGTRRAKPEYEDVAHGATVTGRTFREISDLARRASELEWSDRGT